MSDFFHFLQKFKKKHTPFSLKTNRTIIKSNTPLIMGIINTTPDSFFERFTHKNPDKILKKVESFISNGASIIDIGGESSRPYSTAISIDQEITRTQPIINKLREYFDIPISIDTYKADVAKVALDAGADIINDISGMALDPQMESLVIQNKTTIILNHMQGRPQTMQENPQYKDILQSVCSFLLQKSNTLISKGHPKEQICLDPGIGFGKTTQHNITLLQQLPLLKEINPNILIGLSRKSFIQQISGLNNSNRLVPSLILNSISFLQGATILRVHDVKETKEALDSIFGYIQEI